MEPMKPMKPMEPMKPMAPMAAPDTNWWPQGLSNPSSSGGQNGMRYAFFPDQQRLAIERDGKIELYDTGERIIQGVSQASGQAKGSATFQDASGEVALDELDRIQDH